MLQGIYAQSFICVSMNASTTNLVGISLLKMRPKYYSQSLPGAQLPLFPDIDIALRSTGTIQSLPYAISVGGLVPWHALRAGGLAAVFEWR